MKIIYVYDTIAVVGGIERIFVDKMNYLADHLHHEVYLITSSQGEHPISFPLSPNVQHIDLDIRYHVCYGYPLPQRIWMKFRLQQLSKKRLKDTIKKIDPKRSSSHMGRETLSTLQMISRWGSLKT